MREFLLNDPVMLPVLSIGLAAATVFFLQWCAGKLRHVPDDKPFPVGVLLASIVGSFVSAAVVWGLCWFFDPADLHTELWWLFAVLWLLASLGYLLILVARRPKRQRKSDGVSTEITEDL